MSEVICAVICAQSILGVTQLRCKRSARGHHLLRMCFCKDPPGVTWTGIPAQEGMLLCSPAPAAAPPRALGSPCACYSQGGTAQAVRVPGADSPWLPCFIPAPQARVSWVQPSQPPLVLIASVFVFVCTSCPR